MKAPAVYILASQRNGTLYIGVTSNLIQRIWQHREGVVEGFTQQYGVKRWSGMNSTKPWKARLLVKKPSKNGIATGNCA